MEQSELKEKIFDFFKAAEKEITNNRTEVAKNQLFLKEHNFNLEAQALLYKDEAFAESHYILYELEQKVNGLFK